jgi:primase-polymerase (primpol)-like protein
MEIISSVNDGLQPQFLVKHISAGKYYDALGNEVINLQDTQRGMDEAHATAIVTAWGEGWTVERIGTKTPSMHPSLQAYRQFIVYKSVPSESRPNKTDKLPCDCRTGKVVSAHEPQYWTDFATAQATAAAWGSGWGVGFVFTEQDPFWFLDIDNALQGGQWSPLALSLCQLFAGCYVEISQSGTGLHIIGTGVPPAHACKNEPLGLEFYHSGRFVALTGIGEMGSASMDASSVLPALVMTYFPLATQPEAREWTDGHELGWVLPGDDELIRRAMNMKSANAAFGGKPSFEDLFTRNVSVLSKAYPAQGRDFDESSADMALASYCAWLTGNDCPRIERFMRKSALVRDKWEDHKTYLSEFTIPKALVKDGNFYDPNYHVNEAKRRQEQIEENIRIGKGSEQYPSSSVLTMEEMLARYVYIIEGKQVVDLECPRRIFALDEWKSAHKSSRTVLEVKGEYKGDGTPKTKSHETTGLWEANPDRKQLDTATFRAGFNQATEDPNGKSAANTWRPIERTPAAGSGLLFDSHVSYLFGADATRFLDWLAHIEQRPGELPHTGWVHISPMQGTGRNWLASVLCRLWRGHVAASFDLAGTLHTGFNGPLSQKLLAIVDEINEGGANARWENAEVLKSLVTAEHRHINPKYGHQRLEWNACRWLIFSNHASALPLTERDRRFNIVRNENPPMPKQHYSQLYAALNDPGFIASVAWKLRTRDISAFNPGEHAVMNEAKRELVGASQSDVDDVIANLVAEHRADVIANSTLGPMLTNQPFGKMTSHHRHALERAGVRPYGKAVRLGSAVTKVSILRNHEFWKTATPPQIQAELAKGSAAMGVPLPFGAFAVN